MKYHSNQGSHRYEVAEKPKTNKQKNNNFLHNELAAKVIMNCRTTAARKCRTKLGFK